MDHPAHPRPVVRGHPGRGKKLPRGGSEIGIASVAICFVLALAVATGWVQRVNHPPATSHGTETEAVVEGEHAAAHAGGQVHAATVEPGTQEAPAAEGGHEAPASGEGHAAAEG